SISVTGVEEIRSRRAETACDSRPHVVVVGKMLPSQEPFQVLEQMVVARSKIRTLVVMAKLLQVEPLQQLCAQRWMRTSVVVERSFSEYHLLQHLKRFLAEPDL
ncbi:hypothetical protein AVEN_67644-2-1, partial [Araneus ventricosus]